MNLDLHGLREEDLRVETRTLKPCLLLLRVVHVPTGLIARKTIVVHSPDSVNATIERCCARIAKRLESR